MLRYRLSGNLTVGVKDCVVELPEPAGEELEFQDALCKYIEENMKILDIKGGLSGDRGIIDFVDVTEITDWEFD